MTARQQWGVVGGVVLVLAAVLWFATRALGDELFPVTVGSDAPPFAAQTVAEGTGATTKTLADYRGEVVLLNVWATWCAPCRKEMPSIQRLHERFADRGLRVVAVSVDNPGSEPAIRDFATELGLTFELLHDPDGSIETAYQTTGVPETFVIDREGRIRKKVIGDTDWDSPANRALVASLLGAPDAAPAAPGADAPAATPVPAAPAAAPAPAP